MAPLLQLTREYSISVIGTDGIQVNHGVLGGGIALVRSDTFVHQSTSPGSLPPLLLGACLGDEVRVTFQNQVPDEVVGLHFVHNGEIISTFEANNIFEPAAGLLSSLLSTGQSAASSFTFSWQCQCEGVFELRPATKPFSQLTPESPSGTYGALVIGPSTVKWHDFMNLLGDSDLGQKLLHIHWAKFKAQAATPILGSSSEDSLFEQLLSSLTASHPELEVHRPSLNNFFDACRTNTSQDVQPEDKENRYGSQDGLDYGGGHHTGGGHFGSVGAGASDYAMGSTGGHDFREVDPAGSDDWRVDYPLVRSDPEPPAPKPPRPIQASITAPAPSPLAPAPSRYLNARTPKLVQVQKEFALTVDITTEATPKSAGNASVPFPTGVSGRLKIDVYSPDITCLEDSTLPLDIPETGNSTPIRFALRAEKAGLLVLTVNAWKGPVMVASLVVGVAVEVSVSRKDLTVTSDMDLRNPDEGEYTLEVVFENEKSRYRFQLRSDEETLEPTYSEPLIGDRASIIAGITGKLNREARNLNRFTKDQQFQFLQGLGSELYEQLVPAQLKQSLWHSRAVIKRLNIISYSDSLPWEVLFVMDPDGGEGFFLADTATVSRWQYGPRAPAQLRCTPAYVVVPPGAPAEASQEIQWVSTLCGETKRIDQLDDLLALTKNGGFGVLHFAAHNVASPTPMESFYIPFGDTRFDMTFMSAVARNKYMASCPLVFMNACTTAGTAPLATEMAGWAGRFLRSGCAAFVGTLWEVRDNAANKFAQAFYAAVSDGQNLGEAMMAGKKAIDPADPTHLAYTLYGNPLATFAPNHA